MDLLINIIFWAGIIACVIALYLRLKEEKK